MSFFRAILAELRLAYVPKIGKFYRYENDGPFDIGPVAVPKELKEGYVLYEVFHRDGMVSTHACGAHIFASMYKETQFPTVTPVVDSVVQTGPKLS